MKFFFFLVLSLLGQKIWAQTPYIPAARLLNAKGYEAFVGADYFKTSTRVNKNGSKVSFERGEKFQRYQGEAGLRYGLAKSFQIGLSGRYRRNESVQLVNDETFSASSSGLQSILTTVAIGTEPVNRLQYSLEGFFRYVPYSYSEKDAASSDVQKDLILGDVGNEYGAGGALTYASPSNNYLSARAGWRRPGDFLSSEIYWQAEAAAVWRSVALVAGVDGVSSLGNGDTDMPVYNKGTTNQYHSFEREWITPYVGLNFSLGDSWRMELRGSHVYSGKSTDLGTGFGIQLVRRVEQNPNKLVDKRFKSYDLEVTVTKVSPKKNYVVVDKGLAEDMTKGMRLDFYEFDYMGGNVLVARGVVIQVKTDTSIVKITQQYNLKKEIKTGLVGRGQLK